MQSSAPYTSGDWVVHRQFGVGQIKGIEKKRIAGEETMYSRVQSENSTFWIPVTKLNDEWLRPLASPSEFEEALAVLESRPREMDKNLNVRKKRLSQISSFDSPATIAEILRDLWALKKEKLTLSQNEEAALRHLTQCFVSEWSISLKIDPSEARMIFDTLLRKSYQAKN